VRVHALVRELQRRPLPALTRGKRRQMARRDIVPVPPGNGPQATSPFGLAGMLLRFVEGNDQLKPGNAVALLDAAIAIIDGERAELREPAPADQAPPVRRRYGSRKAARATAPAPDKRAKRVPRVPRSRGNDREEAGGPPPLEVNGVVIDPSRGEVKFAGKTAVLAGNPLRLVMACARDMPDLVERETIIARVWGGGAPSDRRDRHQLGAEHRQPVAQGDRARARQRARRGRAAGDLVTRMERRT